uniref:Uncharacterized protein n=1 Tax=Romanomermis culicivorax TaxID=13658 RepID=A0A915HVU2_ROMCU
MSNLDARLLGVQAKLSDNAPNQPNMPPRFISSSLQPENITQNSTGLNIQMLIRDEIERESKKANAVLFSLPEDEHNDFQSIKKIINDHCDNDDLTADDVIKRQCQGELVAELNQHKASVDFNWFIDFRNNCSSDFWINLVSPSLNASRKSSATIGQSVAQK